jgi:hypothetical protein
MNNKEDLNEMFFLMKLPKEHYYQEHHENKLNEIFDKTVQVQMMRRHTVNKVFQAETILISAALNSVAKKGRPQGIRLLVESEQLIL